MTEPPEATDPVRRLSTSDSWRIRHTVYNIHLLHKLPTVNGVLEALQDGEKFKCGDAKWLRETLIKLGFIYMKVKVRKEKGKGKVRWLLKEKDQILLMRVNYTRAVETHREQDRDIVYVYETTFPTQKCGDVTLLFAGGATGPILEAIKVFQATETGPTKENYEWWLKKCLLPNLYRPNTVVAVYNSLLKKTLEKQVIFNGKEDLKEYLVDNNIKFDPEASGIELQYLVGKHVRRHKPYSMEKIITECGHYLAVIPDYHSDFNVAEKIWEKVSDIKVKEGQISSQRTPEELQEFIRLSTSHFPREEWLETVEKATASEAEQYRIDHEIDDYFDEKYRMIGKPASLMDETNSEDETDSGDSTDSE